MRKFWGAFATTVLCALCDALSANAVSVAASPIVALRAPMIVSVNKIPSLSDPYAYRYELVYQILEATRPEYGDYQFKNYEAELTSPRQAEFLGKGKVVNLTWASPGSVIANANAIPIPIDILNGLLGYRICIINNSAPLDMDKISDAASLSNIKIGQGLWIDVDIYKFNNLTPIAIPSFDNLFSMLSAKRIDCIALGINEVELIYEQKRKAFPAITMDNNLLIYYYFPTYFYVSKSAPELAKRIALGLTKLKNSGAFDKLFMQYHAKELANLKLKKRKVICLNSPHLHHNETCTAPLTFGNKMPAPNMQ